MEPKEPKRDRQTLVIYLLAAALLLALGGYVVGLFLAGGSGSLMPGMVQESASGGPRPMVSADAEPREGEAPLTVRFTGVYMTGSQMGGGETGPIVEYRWAFGDGSTSRERFPVHTYEKPGTYQATFWVKTQNGETASQTIAITVHEPSSGMGDNMLRGRESATGENPFALEVSARPKLAQPGETVAVQAVIVSRTAPHTRVEVRFSVDEGEVKNLSVVVPPYQKAEADFTWEATAGLHRLRVELTSPAGVQYSAWEGVVGVEVTDVSKPMVSPDADPLEGEAPLTVAFIGIAMPGSEMAGWPPTGPIVATYWDFGDGAISKELYPTHTYEEPGVYEATFWALAQNGGIAYQILRIAVREKE